MKISIEKALAEYTLDELRQFNANLVAIETCTTESNMSVLTLILHTLNEIQRRGDRAYVKALNKVLDTPEEYQYK